MILRTLPNLRLADRRVNIGAIVYRPEAATWFYMRGGADIDSASTVDELWARWGGNVPVLSFERREIGDRRG